MKQVLEMFQIKMEGPDVNQKKIYRGEKKRIKSEMSEGCLISMTDLLTPEGGKCHL